MSFCLKPDKPLSEEIRRIVLRQLEAGSAELTSVGDPKSDDAIHDARRRVKKVRAVIRLVQPGRNKGFRAVDKDLHDVSRLLAPVADGRGIIATLDALAHLYRKRLPKPVVDSIRAGLLDRAAQTARQARSDHVLPTSAATLKAERRRVKYWEMRTEGFRALAPGIETNFRQSRKAMLAARRRPTVEQYHEWRRLVKNHWFHLRLLASRCGYHLRADQSQLETLDGVLGECHNLAMLLDVLANHSYVSRAETARCLRVVSAYQRLLRQQAQSFGAAIYREKPRDFVKRIRHFWKEALADHRAEGSAR
jgi:CHAD domain-containing protein